jgi:hypothetical protein
MGKKAKPLARDAADGFAVCSSPMPELRFPPPWSVEEQDACFVVRDIFRELAGA